MSNVLTPGQVIARKYRVERTLARGGMGVVVLATHLQLGETVAIKVLLPEVASNPDTVARFLREAKAAARIKNEHVVRVFDVGTMEAGQVYIVMEYLEGVDLDNTIRNRGELPLEEAVDYVLQACEGVAEAHRIGVVHRDLKPANLFLVQRSDGSYCVKLLDFGISKQAPTGGADVSVTRTSMMMGSPLYMSPEQLRSTRSVDARTDIWSLGVVLYEALTGKSPFIGETFAAVCARVLAEAPDPLRPDVPAEVAQVIERCLSKQPDARYPDIGAFAQALRPFAPLEAQMVADRVVRIMKSPVAATSSSIAGADDIAALARSASTVAATASTFTATNHTRKMTPSVVALMGLACLLFLGTVVGGGYVAYRFLSGRSARLAAAPESVSAAATPAPPPAAATAPTPANTQPPVNPPAAESARALAASSTAPPQAGTSQPPASQPKTTRSGTRKKSSKDPFGGRE